MTDYTCYFHKGMTTIRATFIREDDYKGYLHKGMTTGDLWFGV